MNTMGRREALKLGGALAAGASVAPALAGPAAEPDELARLQQAVNFIYDGSHLSPLEYAHLLNQVAAAGPLHPDVYSNGGIVEALEHTFARWLGKENAVFMPTGTLANHVALRELAGTQRRVIVQAESHIYNDSGDCAQQLSGLNLVPLSPGRVGFTLAEVQEAVRRSRSGRVETDVGVICIESPVRRMDDAVFGYDEMRRIAAFARQEGIRLHLDGARLFVESAHTGISPARYAALFDTVYVSLYKCFNSVSGAVLAGTRAFTENLFHVRRMFGSGLPGAWPYAAVALEFVDDFIAQYTSAWHKAEALFRALTDHPAFRVEPIADGTHVVPVYVSGTDPERFREQLGRRNIHLPPPRWPGGFWLKINPSLNRMPAEDVAQAFVAAL
jgi:threonine aldolase